MKKLDEVIDKLEKADSTWRNIRNNLNYEDFRDALHYLKNYRDTKAWLNLEKQNYAEAVKNCERAEAKYTRMALDMNRNVPLTWEELRQMEGKPVWAEVDGKWWGRFWAFVEVENDSYIDLFQKGQEYPEDLWKRDMGKTWNAFRKERK